MNFNSPFSKPNEKELLNDKIKNYFENIYNLDKILLKYHEDLRLLSNLNFQIKTFSNKTSIIEEILNQKCKKCRQKLLEEMDCRSKTPTQPAHFHAQNHTNKTATKNRSVTPTLKRPKKQKEITGVIKEKVPKNIKNIKKEHKITTPDKNRKVYQASSPDLVQKKKNPIKKNIISKSPVGNQHMRLYTSVSKEKQNTIDVNNNKKLKTAQTISARKSPIKQTLQRALTPTVTLKKKKTQIDNQKKHLNENEKKAKKENDEKALLKESIEQLKESVKLVNNSISQFENQKSSHSTLGKSKTVIDKDKKENNNIKSNVQDNSTSPSFTHRNIQSNIESKAEIINKLTESKDKPREKTPKFHKTIQSTITKSQTMSEQKPQNKKEENTTTIIQSSKIAKKVNRQNIHTIPKTKDSNNQKENKEKDNKKSNNSINNSKINKHDIKTEEILTIKEENEETRISSIKNSATIPIKETDKRIQSLILLLKSNYLSINKKISLITSSPLLYKEFPLKSLIKEKINYIEKVLVNITEFISKHVKYII